MDKYTNVRLTADLSALTDNQRAMLPLLIEAADVMDERFRIQAFGPREARQELLAHPSEAMRDFARINYGPWDRLADNEPFVEEMGQVGPQLQPDLDRLAEAGIPVDIAFEQGVAVLERTG